MIVETKDKLKAFSEIKPGDCCYVSNKWCMKLARGYCEEDTTFNMVFLASGELGYCCEHEIVKVVCDAKVVIDD